MIYKICYDDGDYKDYFFVEGETIEEIRLKASAETSLRGWSEENCWSERIDGVEKWLM